MSETAPNDNSVKIELDIDQVEAGRPLSTANLAITYPGIARNLGNMASYDTTLAVVLQSIEWHLQQANLYTPEDLSQMVWWLNNIAGKFTALAEKYASPQASGLVAPAAASSTPGVPGK